MFGHQSSRISVFLMNYTLELTQMRLQAGKAFINYLSRFSNVDFILTTQFFKPVFFKEHDKISNHKMEVVIGSGEFNYTYKLKGISTLKGGIRVLKDLGYPDEILKEVE